MLDDFYFIIPAVSDASKYLVQRNETKKETMYEIIEEEL
jgi:hypothetical protein